MQLLELPSGLISLEYAVEEHDEVCARLSEIAPVSMVDHTTYSVVSVDGTSFIHMSDWDDPCLIAQDRQGNAILRRVCDPGSIDTSIAAE